MNKNAQGKTDFLKILLALIIVGVLIYMWYTSGWRALPFIQSCEDQGGTCLDSGKTCDSLNLRDAEYVQEIKGCGRGNICCIQKGVTPGDIACDGKVNGDVCDTTSVNKAVKLCTGYDESLSCVSLCDYCSDNPDSDKCKNTKLSNNQIVKFDSKFSCSCTPAQCSVKSSTGLCVYEPDVPKEFCEDSRKKCCQK